ncbi:YigZ family protein [Phytomonospora endophytica]|uniref:Putative YigZ family protein n=1 Tax=Phytomonospora endophytica TaxID=714109 RepID=A0A841FN36_9ACTN|nr:YigZ family protein [Phytomonospora endophytica]MBB6034637.1 putative YigZ family protein [Phytomonospora endophytica]GIG69162.1 YigZ family protein [Phytomonospora endophytica]
MRMISRGGVTEIEIRRSRFICAVARVSTEDDAAAFIAARRREHRAATHNCTAYVLGEHAELGKSNDDGEPAGTAGVPMLEVLHRRGLTDTVAVVTRYFGGVKLGAGGLVRAYGQSVTAALDDVGAVERVPVTIVTIDVDHTRAGRLIGDLHARGHRLGDTRYGTGVAQDVYVPDDELHAFTTWAAEATAGQAVLTRGASTYVEIPVEG